jgi:hypothetical protein
LTPHPCLCHVEQKLAHERVGVEYGDGIDADARRDRDSLDPTSP